MRRQASFYNELLYTETRLSGVLYTCRRGEGRIVHGRKKHRKSGYEDGSDKSPGGTH